MLPCGCLEEREAFVCCKDLHDLHLCQNDSWMIHVRQTRSRCRQYSSYFDLCIGNVPWWRRGFKRIFNLYENTLKVVLFNFLYYRAPQTSHKSTCHIMLQICWISFKKENIYPKKKNSFGFVMPSKCSQNVLLKYLVPSRLPQARCPQNAESRWRWRWKPAAWQPIAPVSVSKCKFNGLWKR